VWVISTAIVLATISMRESEDAGRRITRLDIAAVGAAAAAAIGLARGGLSADSLASGSGRTLLLLLPGLICFAGAVVAARLLRPVMRLGERVSRQVEQATARAAKRAEEAARRLERHAERQARRWGGNVSSDPWNWNVGPRGVPTPPSPASEPVAEEERMAILKMLAEKKITAEQAEQLLNALEGGK